MITGYYLGIRNPPLQQELHCRVVLFPTANRQNFEEKDMDAMKAREAICNMTKDDIVINALYGNEDNIVRCYIEHLCGGKSVESLRVEQLREIVNDIYNKYEGYREHQRILEEVEYFQNMPVR